MLLRFLNIGPLLLQTVVALFARVFATVICVVLWAATQTIYNRLYLSTGESVRFDATASQIAFAAGSGILVLVFLYIIWKRKPEMEHTPEDVTEQGYVEKQWSPDAPLVDPTCDALDYAASARHFADSICRMPPKEGLVISVFGPWGSGKTTFVNFVMHYVQQKPQKDQPIVVYFNPWWFSGREDLIGRYFAQLLATFRRRQVITASLRSHIALFVEAISEVPLPYVSAAKGIARLIKPQPRDVAELKETIEDELSKQQKMLVVIDDIDRLTSEEIRQVFRLVKAVANFPNTVYLLAMDKDVAVAALAEEQGGKGEDYLGKIVQYPFTLPVADRPLVQKFLFSKLDEILSELPVGALDQTYWGNVYLDGIDYFIKTPRDAVRLANSVMVAYSTIASDVNVVDLIAIEAIRVFCPSAYNVMSGNPNMFAGSSPEQYSSPTKDELVSFHRVWIDRIPEEERGSIQRLLVRLFPKLEAVWGSNVIHGSDWETTWRKQRRVCSREMFRFYFVLAVPQGSISPSEIQYALGLVSDQEAFGSYLMQLAGQDMSTGMSRVRAFLQRIEDYTATEIKEEHVPHVIAAFSQVSDKLIDPAAEHGFLSFSNELRVTRIMYQLVIRMREDVRFDVLATALRDSQAIAMMSHFLDCTDDIARDRESPAGSNQARFLTEQQLAELKSIMVSRIATVASGSPDVLLDNPRLRYVLHIWLTWGDEDAPRAWVRAVIADDKRLIRFLENSVQERHSQSMGDMVVRKHRFVNLDSLTPFFAASEIIDRVRCLSHNTDLSESALFALKSFIEAYEEEERGDPGC